MTGVSAKIPSPLSETDNPTPREKKTWARPGGRKGTRLPLLTEKLIQFRGFSFEGLSLKMGIPEMQ